MRAVAAVDLLRPRLLTGPRLRVARWRRVLVLAVLLWLSSLLLWGVTALRLRATARALAAVAPAAAPLPSPPDLAAFRERLDALRSLDKARRWSETLPALLHACPQGTEVTAVRAGPQGITLSGAGPDLAAAAACAARLGSLPGVAEVRFEGATLRPARDMAFDLRLTATPPGGGVQSGG